MAAISPGGPKLSAGYSRNRHFGNAASGKRLGVRFHQSIPLAGDFDLWTRFYEYAELYGTFSPLAGFRYQHAQRGLQKAQYENEAERSLQPNANQT